MNPLHPFVHHGQIHIPCSLCSVVVVEKQQFFFDSLPNITILEFRKLKHLAEREFVAEECLPVPIGSWSRQSWDCLSTINIYQRRCHITKLRPERELENEIPVFAVFQTLVKAAHLHYERARCQKALHV